MQYQQIILLLKLYGFSMLLLLLFYIIGSILFLPFYKNNQAKSTSFFFKLLLGSLAAPCLVALIFTKGQSILVILPLLYIGALIQIRPFKPTFHSIIEWRFLGSSLAWLLFFLCIQIYANDFFNESISSLHFGDTGIYTAVAAYLPISGVEVSSPWYQLFEEVADGREKPYHYGDLWQFAFVLKLFTGGVPVQLYIYVYLPVLITISVFGKIVLFQTVTPSKIYKSLFLLFAALCALYNTAIPGIEWSFFFLKNILMQPKVFIVEHMLLAVCFAFLKHKNILAGVFACVIPIFNIVLAPVIFSAFFLWALWNYYSTGFKSASFLKELFLYPIIAVYIIGFYYFSGSFETSSVNIEPKAGGYIYWFIKNVVALGVKHFIFHITLYFFGYLIWLKRKEISLSAKQLVVLCFLILFFGAIYTAVFNNNFEHFQFNELTFTPVSSILFLLLGAILLQILQKGWLKRLVIAIFFGQITYSVIATIFLFPQVELVASASFVQEVKINLKNKNPLGGFIMNSETENSVTADPRICYFCSFLRLIDARYWANSLSVPERKENIRFKERTKAIQISPFYQFIQQQKKDDHYNNYQDAQIQFINKYNINFIIVDSGAVVPKAILRCSYQEIADPLTGDRVLLINPPCKSY